MMKYILFIIAVTIWSGCYSQKKLPMEDCICYFNIDSLSQRPYYSPNYSLIINSDKPEVMSLSKGVVSKIINSNGALSVIIRSDNLFYIYSDISVFSKKIKVNKNVSKGDVIGKGIKSKNIYSSQLQIYKGSSIIPDANKYVNCNLIKIKK
ncbi:hypothetical protein [Chryseobacterium indologenes]|uniref:hypothetical protein n=1 Tax=Chryseobacterium indologenes TaxID=253 RepID=UPI001BCB4A35|nr:hypothetical protein [Chryseobacterium indologenes]